MVHCREDKDAMATTSIDLYCLTNKANTGPGRDREDEEASFRKWYEHVVKTNKISPVVVP